MLSFPPPTNGFSTSKEGLFPSVYFIHGSFASKSCRLFLFFASALSISSCICVSVIKFTIPVPCIILLLRTIFSAVPCIHVSIHFVAASAATRNDLSNDIFFITDVCDFCSPDLVIAAISPKNIIYSTKTSRYKFCTPLLNTFFNSIKSCALAASIPSIFKVSFMSVECILMNVFAILNISISKCRYDNVLFDQNTFCSFL